MRQRLLIVDDERGIVDMMKSYFEVCYEVTTAYSGREALDKATKKPDLILLDINMPGMDGLTVCPLQTNRRAIWTARAAEKSWRCWRISVENGKDTGGHHPRQPDRMQG